MNLSSVKCQKYAYGRLIIVQSCETCCSYNMSVQISSWCVHVCDVCARVYHRVCVCVCVYMCACVFIRVQKLLMLLHTCLFFLFIQLLVSLINTSRQQLSSQLLLSVKWNLLSRRSTVLSCLSSQLLILIPLSCAQKIQAPDSPRNRISCHKSCVKYSIPLIGQSVNVVAVCTHAWLHD